MSKEKEKKFRRDLWRWWKQHRRDFLWRRTEDPYAILISEIMLQQTQADRVLPKYEAFMKRFPNITALSNARSASVIREWQGLGYNSRALWLKAAAQMIVANYRGAVPREEEELIALPGVGLYTAKAIRAFAWNLQSAPVDTNIRRILIRHFGIVAENDLQTFANQMTPRGRSRDWSAMLMDFGALVCTASNPSCAALGMKHILEPKPGAKQKPFKDSDRFWRGRIVEVLRGQPEVSSAVLWREIERLGGTKISKARVEHIVKSLLSDGLILKEKSTIKLP